MTVSPSSPTSPGASRPSGARRSPVEVAPDFPVLDTLRAVGALAVLTTHTAFQSGDYTRHGLWGVVLARLDVGVALFFVLSGFLLARPHLARAAAGVPKPSIGRYYWKRLLRIYPVYAVTVVIALLFVDDNEDAGPGTWVTTLLLANTYVDRQLPQGLTQMWSLGVEVAFYLVLPLLMAIALGREPRRLRGRRVVVLLVVLTAISTWWHLHGGLLLSERVPGTPLNWLPGFLVWFAVGIGLALAHVAAQRDDAPHPVVRRLQHLGAMPGVCWAMTAGLLLVAATPLAGATLLFVASPAEALTKSLLYAGIGGLVVLTGVFPRAGSRYARALSAPALRHLGHISYSIFCIHLPLLHLVRWLTGYPLFSGHHLEIWSLTLVSSLVASELLYRLVERPPMRLKDRRPPWARPAAPTRTATQQATTK